MTTLLPCPFCGGSPLFRAEVVYPNKERSPSVVRCSECGVYYATTRGDDAVVDTWNKRPTVTTCTWKREGTEYGDMYVCSACNNDFMYTEWTPQECHVNYCPSCGAKITAFEEVEDE